MQSKPLLLVGIGALLLVACRFGIIIILHVFTSMHVLIAGREKEAEFIVENAVSVG